VCNAAGDYLWSSHPGYGSSAKKWDWLHKDFLLGMFDQDLYNAKKQYYSFVLCFLALEILLNGSSPHTISCKIIQKYLNQGILLRR